MGGWEREAKRGEVIRLHLHAYMQVSRGVMTRRTRVPRCIYREGCPQSMMGRGEAGYAIATDALLIRWITDGVQLARYGLQQIFLWWQEETRGLLQGPVPCDTLIPILSQDGDPSDDPRRFLVVVYIYMQYVYRHTLPCPIIFFL